MQSVDTHSYQRDSFPITNSNAISISPLGNGPIKAKTKALTDNHVSALIRLENLSDLK